jgi:parvulin-like peptidyl-prolyl isomerase
VSRTLRLLPALGAVLFALVGLSACGGGVPGDSVATVAGTSITNATFKHWIGVASVSTAASSGEKPAAPEPPAYTACIARQRALAEKEPTKKSSLTQAALKKQCETQYKSLTQEVLSFLLSAQWVIEEAKVLGVKVTDAQVKKQFQSILKTQFSKPGEFQRFLRSSGETVSDLLLRVKLNMLSTRIQQKVAKQKGQVTNAQIEKYYNENKSRYGSPEKRNVAIILTKSEAAASKAKQEVQSGKSFASVAKAVSVDAASKANGGLLTEVVKGQEEQGLDRAIFSASKGTLTGPVKTPFGYYVLEVRSITPGTQQSLSQVRSAIKAQLQSTSQQEALTKFVKAFKVKWKAKTDCRSGYVVPDCKQYKAPKAGAATTEAG